MKPMKICSVLLAVAILLSATGCSASPIIGQSEENSSGVQAGVSQASSLTSAVETALVTDVDLATTWDSSATAIELADTATVIGSGAKAIGDTVKITEGGTYVVSGESAGGQIIVEAPKTTTVHLVLNGVTITSDTSAAIDCRQANQLIVTLAEGTVNVLTDAETYNYYTTEKEEPDAALFSTVDLTLNGTGELIVNARCNNGIGTKDNLIIADGTYTINAANHGIRGRDSLTILAGNFQIHSGNDGLQSNNDSDVSKGGIQIEGGTFDIISAHDGIQAETILSIAGGEFQITAGGGSQSQPVNDGTDSDSYKGLKAGAQLTITNGVFRIDSADDSVHSNGSIAISDADMTLFSGDDGIHGDDTLTIHSGAITIPTSVEGIEASTIIIEDGEIDITASDDGVNVAGGIDDNTQTMARPNFGGDRFGSSGKNWLYIHGGTLTIDAMGDGIDANGSIQMTGGQVYVNGPIGQGDGALDFDDTFSMDGGTLIAVGSSGMLQSPSDSSQQPSITMFFSQQYPESSVLSLEDSAGNELLSFPAKKEFSAAVISSEDTQLTQEYTILIDGQAITSVLLSDTITRVSETGQEFLGTAGGPRGMGMRDAGGMPPEMGGAPATETRGRPEEPENKKR